MKTKCVLTVIGLSQEILPVVESAVSLLKSVRQGAFVFESGGSCELSSNLTSESARLWSELETVLVAERQRRKCELLVAVLNEPIEKNWFSHAAYGKRVAWITAHDWEFYSDIPVASFVAYDIVLNMVLMQLVTRPEQEAWLMGEVVHITETRECISDMCAYKPDISRKIRSGKICHDCQEIFAARMGKERLAEILTLLKTISRSAQPTSSVPTIWDFPVLSRMQERTEHFLNEAHERVETQKSRVENLETERRILESRLKDVEQRRKAEVKRVRESKARLEMLHQSVMAVGEVHCQIAEAAPVATERPGLPEQVEKRYPFPIAYCFRALRAELNPTDRWATLFELYALIIRYLVFALLNGLRDERAGYPEDLKPLIQKLKFGFAGDWGKACIALLKHWQRTDGESFFETFLVTLSAEMLDRFEAASKSLVQTRNSIEHGFKGDKQGCQAVFERHLPDIKNMLQFIEPLADYVLIRPVQILDNVDGQCLYFSKIMAGSDPQFLPQQMISSSVPETVCQLLSPEGNTLTLHPWLHLNRCDSCLREMVFVYDAIQVKEGKEAVLLREYPSNHEQRRPALLPQVKKLLFV